MWCGRHAGQVTMSREHLIKDEFKALLGVEAAGLATDVNVRVLPDLRRRARSIPKPMWDLTTKRLCMECNSRSDRDIEAPAKDTLLALIQGRADGVPLLRARPMATWAIRTALVSAACHRGVSDLPDQLVTHLWSELRPRHGACAFFAPAFFEQPYLFEMVGFADVEGSRTTGALGVIGIGGMLLVVSDFGTWDGSVSVVAHLGLEFLDSFDVFWPPPVAQSAPRSARLSRDEVDEAVERLRAAVPPAW